MDRNELIARLQALPEGSIIRVWEGYDAGCVTGEFEPRHIQDNLYVLD